MKDIKKFLNNNLIFAIIVFLVCFIFSVLIPYYQVPDEFKHIRFIYQELGSDIDISYESYAGGKDIALDLNKKFDIKNYDLKDKGPKLTLGTPKITVVGHLPQVVGILIGNVFKLPYAITILLGEMFAALFYAFFVYKALKYYPYNKLPFKLIMLLPICIQQAGSFSYDVMLFSLSYLLIAYILHIKEDKPKFETKDVIYILLMLMGIALVKIPYILLGALIFLIPLKKYNLKIGKFVINEDIIKKNKIFIIIAFIIIFILGILVVKRVGEYNVLLAFLLNPIGLIKTIFFTLKEHVFGYVYTLVGNLAWLNIKTSYIYGIFIFLTYFIFMTCVKEEKKVNLSKRDKIFIFAFIIIFFIIIQLALYDWTVRKVYNFEEFSNIGVLDKVKYISEHNIGVSGVQGRYFIPLLPLFSLLFVRTGKNKNTKIFKIYEILYYIVLVSYLAYVIINRFWI